MAEVILPVKTKADLSGVEKMERAWKKFQQQQIRDTRAQIAEHKKVLQLARQLDKELSKSKGPSFGQQIGSAVGGQFFAANIAADAVAGIKDFTVESIRASMAAERLERATNTLGARFGTSGGEIVDAIQEASGNTINQMNAMQAANQAMLLGVAKSPEEFERLTKIAVALGRAMGQDATKSVEDLTIGIGRQSRLILDNLGIMVNAQSAYERYAKTLGKNANELTDVEKQQAFLNEALDQGERKIAGMTGQTETAADKTERLVARWSDFQIEFGGALQQMSNGAGVLDALSMALDGVTTSLDAFNKAAAAEKHLEEQHLKTASAFEKGLDTANDWVNTLNPAQGALNQLGKVLGATIFNSEELAKAQEDLEKQQAAGAGAADEHTAAEEDNADAMKEAEKAAKELAKHLEMVADTRKDVARSLMDIEATAAKDTEDTWDEYFEREQEAWEDHQKNIAKIQADAAKEAAKIQKELGKNLAKEDKSARKDVEKIERDSARNIARTQQDQAKEQRRIERQRQIDTKADQRLFDFDMRQLAAEGEFNQIQQAMERREIEEQIAAEQRAEEDANAAEDNRLEIDRMRQDEADAKAERLAQAEERKQELRDQAAEELAANQEKLAEELLQEQESYAAKMEDLRKWRDDKLTQIEESKQESIAKLAEELTESKDLTRSEMESMVAIAEELGPEVGSKFAEGLNDGLLENLRISQIVGAALGSTSSGGGGRNPATGGTFAPGSGSSVPSGTSHGPPRFQHGGAFTVGGFGGTDSQLVQFMATPGERVTVSNGSPNITINASGVGVSELVAILERKVNEGIAEYHDSVIVPFSHS